MFVKKTTPILIALMLGLVTQAFGESNDRQKQLNAIHKQQAANHKFELDGVELKLRLEPIYVWTNPTRNSVQEGAVFVWEQDGRPQIISTIFSHPSGEPPTGRQVNHEFHSLARGKFVHSHPSQSWKPKSGITTRKVTGAKAVAPTEARRKLQMRSIAREFSAHSETTTREGKLNRVQLRMLPRPVMVYEPKDENILQGGLFVFAAGVGTDPEVVLLLEAVRSSESDEFQWEYAACRYSDLELFVRHKDQEVWTSQRGGGNGFMNDAQHLYRLMFVDQVPLLAADTKTAQK